MPPAPETALGGEAWQGVRFHHHSVGVSSVCLQIQCCEAPRVPLAHTQVKCGLAVPLLSSQISAGAGGAALFPVSLGGRCSASCAIPQAGAVNWVCTELPCFCSKSSAEGETRAWAGILVASQAATVLPLSKLTPATVALVTTLTILRGQTRSQTVLASVLFPVPLSQHQICVSVGVWKAPGSNWRHL